MKVPFQQGIIRYPYSGSIQQFLQLSGSYINLLADNGPIEVAFAHRSTNYLHVENSTVLDAWGPFTGGVDSWLYWDIDLQTGARTFGITEVQPTFGQTEPTTPVDDLHWFDTINNIMYVYNNGGFVEVARVFAAKFDGTTTFTSMAAGLPNLPFAGSQVGLINSANFAGRIIFDDSGEVLIRNNGELFTTEDQFFASGSTLNAVRLESSIHHATTAENLGAYNIVKYNTSGKVQLAGYKDIGNSVLAITLEDALNGEVVTTIIQGVVTNTSWNWPTIGAELWVSENGILTATDPNTADSLTYPVKQVPIARVLTSTQIIFEQGLGGVGPTGETGAVGTVDNASTSTKGIVLLSADPVTATVPIAVGDNDPRMTDARAPTAHTHVATEVTFTPYGNLSSSTVQAAVQELDDEKLAKVGGTLTGALTLSGDPTLDLQAATKQYVDGLVSGLLWQDPIHYVNLIDDSLTTAPTLTTADASNAYITAGTGGAWSGFPVGSIVIWDGSSWIQDTVEGLLSDHVAGTRFGIALETSTAPGGTFAGRKNQIAVLDNPATPTWSFVAPANSHAVFVNNDESLHAYHQYVYNSYLTSWVEVAGGGVTVAASEVSFTPAGNIAATNVQAAIVELDTEKASTAHVHAASAITFTPTGSPANFVATDVQGALEELEARAIPYDVAAQVIGLPDAGAVVFRFIAARNFTLEGTGHQAKSGTASTGTAAFDIQVNGVSKATVTFTTSTTGVYSMASAVSVAIGDVITIVAPGTQDATLADVGFTLVANIY